MFELAIGVTAALLFPLVAVAVYKNRDSRRNRRAGKRRNDKIKL